MGVDGIVLPLRARVGKLWDLLRTCRPEQWIKNIFVLAPVVFSLRFTHLDSLFRSLLAAGCFCLISSAVYVFNDLVDADADRQHPRKRTRPIAAGRISSAWAVGLIGSLSATAALIGLLVFSAEFMALAGAYVALSVSYCVWLKHKVILDVMSIALGFVLRLLVGCVAVAVDASPWMLVCGFSLALVLGFGKRRVEIAQGVTHKYRRALEAYSPPILDTFLAISTAVCLLSYMLYTVAAETLRRHQTDKLIYTTPLVAYPLFRYVLKTRVGSGGDGPTEILTSDWIFWTAGLLWLLLAVVILSMARPLPQ